MRKLGRVNFRKDFWDRYWGRAGQPLVNFLLSPVTVAEVFVTVNSTLFPFHFLSGIALSFRFYISQYNFPAYLGVITGVAYDFFTFLRHLYI